VLDLRIVSLTEECFDQCSSAYTTQEKEEEEGRGRHTRCKYSSGIWYTQPLMNSSERPDSGELASRFLQPAASSSDGSIFEPLYRGPSDIEAWIEYQASGFTTIRFMASTSGVSRLWVATQR
jgi:hypothetical protein